MTDSDDRPAPGGGCGALGLGDDELIGLVQQPEADRFITDGITWVKTHFEAAQRWQEPPGASEFDPDPPDSPYRGYRRTMTSADEPRMGTGRNPHLRQPG
jgi:hypothetical protein